MTILVNAWTGPSFSCVDTHFRSSAPLSTSLSAVTRRRVTSILTESCAARATSIASARSMVGNFKLFLMSSTSPTTHTVTVKGDDDTVTCTCSCFAKHTDLEDDWHSDGEDDSERDNEDDRQGDNAVGNSAASVYNPQSVALTFSAPVTHHKAARRRQQPKRRRQTHRTASQHSRRPANCVPSAPLTTDEVCIALPSSPEVMRLFRVRKQPSILFHSQLNHFVLFCFIRIVAFCGPS